MSASLEASLRLEIAQYQANLAKAKSEAERFRAQIKTQGKGFGNDLFGGFKDQIAELLPAVGAAAAVAGFRHITNEMDDLADTALRLNETTETIQRVAYASEIMASVDADGLVKSFLKLEKALGDIENADAAKALADLGVTGEALTRMSLDQKVLAIAGAFQSARERGTGYNDILDLLGKSAGDLIPMFMQGKEALAAMFEEAPVVIDDTVQRLAAVNDKIDSIIKSSKAWATGVLGSVIKYFQEATEAEERLRALMEGIKNTTNPDVFVETTTTTKPTLEENKETAAKELARRKKAAEIAAKAKKDYEAAIAAIKKGSGSHSGGGDPFADDLKVDDKRRRNQEAWAKLAEEDMSREERKAALKERLAKAQEEEDQLRSDPFGGAEDRALDVEARRIELQRELNGLLREEEKIEEDKLKKAQEAKQSIADELQDLQMRVNGHEKEADIIEKAREVKAQTGVTDEQALAAAKRMIELKEQLNRKDDTGRKTKADDEAKPGHIGGVTRRRYMTSGLDEFYRNQWRDGQAGKALGAHGLSRRSGPLSTGTGPLSERAARNVADADRKQPENGVIDINKAMLAVLRQGLLGS